MKRKILILVALVLALLTSLTAFFACKPKETPRQSGDEVGEYYCDVNGSEWTITLSEECKFTWKVAGNTKSGTYTLEGTSLALLFDGQDEPEQATLESEVITYSYNGASYRFLLKKNFTVTFVADNATFKTASVVNGKSVAKPSETPTKTDYAFVGWYSDSACKNYYDFDRPVTGDMSLYARFVQKLNTEYDVTFNLGYAGAPTIAARKTTGGKLYELPTPEKAGDTFVGWWVSQSNDRNKLTYQYNEQTLSANTTLFAVWASNAPYVSIGDKKIDWWADGVGNSYKVVITGPNGEIYNRTSNTTSFDLDFATAQGGDYTVAVTLNGKTTTAYFRNKQLAKVTGLKVDGLTLKFDAVANATSYTLSYVCGTAGHNHQAVNLGNNTSYNFEDCAMIDEGFKFVVTASADGWMTSEPSEITFWAGDKVDVTLNVGEYGEEALDKVAITYGATKYTLPVPTSNNVEYAFVGWYSQATGGIAYTDHNGTGTHAWDYTEAKTLYARWAAIMTFEQISGGYSVSATSNIHLVTEITIPEKHNGSTVTTINDFSNATTLKTIKFYNTVTNITVGSIGIAFNGCTNLENIEVLEADGVNDAKFWDVDGVLLGRDETTGDTLIYFYPQKHAIENHTYNIPDGVTRLTAGVFSDDVLPTDALASTTIVTLVVPASVTNVDLRAFYRINRVQTINFLDPADASTAVPLNVANGAFEDMAGLEFINFPARLANFSTAIFTENNPYSDRQHNLSRLHSVTVAEGSDKFAMVGGLITAKSGAERELLYYPTPCRVPLSIANELKYTNEIVIPDGVTSISSTVLLRGTSDVIVGNITSITIANTVTNIKSGAFANLISISADNKTGLSELIFNGTADDLGLTIGEKAFYGNELLAKNSPVLVLPENLVSLGAYAFGGIPGIKTVTVNCGKIYSNLDFADNAFATEDSAHVSYIETVNLGRYVNNVQISGVFGSKVKEVNIDEHNESYASEDGVVFDKNMTTIVFFPEIKTSFTVPNTIAVIGANLFANRTNLQSVTFSASVITIGNNAFKDCTSLSTVTFLSAANAASLTIGEGAFNGCSALKTIELPSRTVSIGKEAFANTGLTSITLNEGLETIGEKAFANTSLTSITIPASASLTVATGESHQKLYSLGSTKYDVTIIDTFVGASALTTINVANGNETLKSVNGVLYGKDTNGAFTEILYVPMNHGGTSGVFTVPSNVTKIWSDAFCENSAITSIVFEESTSLEIGDEAFYAMPNLASLTLANGITKIGRHAFYGANSTSLTSITIPNTVTNIGASAFVNLTKLQTVIFTDGTAPLTLEAGLSENYSGGSSVSADGLFGNCGKLTSITLNRLTEIPDGLFGKAVAPAGVMLPDYPAITTIVIPASVTKIGQCAFFGLKLSSVTFAEGSQLETIANGAFANCKSLTAINLPEGVETIGNYAFYGSNLTGKLTLPASLTTIGNYAFGVNSVSNFGTNYNLTNLTSVEFADGSELESIGEYAFGYATGLTAVTGLGLNLTTISKYAFYNCTSLDTVSFAEGTGSLTTIGDYAFAKNSALKEFAVPASSNDITLGESVFDKCTGMSLTLSANVKVLTDATFNGATFESIDIDSANPNFHSDANLPIIYDKDDAIVFTYGNVTGEITLKGTSIAANAFKGNTGITDIIITATVQTIGTSAFEGCTNLKTVTIANNSELTTIGNSAFKGCTNLETINLEKTRNITSFGTNVFDGCKNLEEVDLSNNTLGSGGGLKALGNYSFANTGTITVKLPSTINFLGTHTFENSGITSIDLSETSLISLGSSASAVTNVGYYVYTFDGCKSLTTVTLPTGLTTIGGMAFRNCSSLSDINLENITLFGEESFRGAGITELEISGAVTCIGHGAFAETKSLTTVTFKEGENVTFTWGTSNTVGIFQGSSVNTVTFNNNNIKSIRKAMFYNCTQLTSVTLPTAITYIDENAFNGTAITSITIPGSVTTLYAGVFANTSGLNTVTFLDNASNAVLTLTAGTTLANSSRSTYGIFENSGVSTVDFGNRNITTIPTAMFYNCKKLTSFTIPSTVAKIGSDAFSKTGLISITIPASVTTLSEDYFYDKWEGEYIYRGHQFADCDKLETVTFNANVTQIPMGMFQNCTKLASIAIPVSVTKINDYAFNNCGFVSFEVPKATFGTDVLTGNTKLETVTFANGVTAIPAGLFKNCTKLQNITFIETITTIGTEAFRNTGFVTLTIPAHITTFATSSSAINDSTKGHQFADCSKLTTLTFATGSQLTSLGCFAFANCADLDTVNFGDIKDLGYRTFDGCTSLSGVTLPETITTYTKGLAELLGETGDTFTLPDTFKAIGAYAFDGSTFTSIILNEGLESIGNYAFRNAKITSIEFPSTLTTIGSNAFYGVTLESITFADDGALESIGSYAFANAIIQNITIPGTFTSIGSNAFESATISNITFSEGLETIGTYAFSGVKGLTSVSFPSTLESIGNNAFYGVALTSITLNEGLKSIGNYAFQNAKFTSIAFPSTLESIGNSAFSGVSLENITLNEGLKSIGNSAFGNYVFASITLPSTLESIGDSVFANATFTSIELPSNLQSIGSSTFAGSALTSITIPNSVTTIGSKAFQNCTSLESVTLSTQLTAISEYLFDGCTGLTSVTMPGNATSIGSYAFRGTGLTTISIPGTVASIGSTAYENCTSLTSATISNGVESIGSNAFKGAGLTSIVIPGSVTSIGSNAFENCTNLSSITLNEGLTSINAYAFAATAIESIALPNTLKSFSGFYQFKNCTNLKAVYIPKGTLAQGTDNWIFRECNAEPTIYTNVSVEEYRAWFSSGNDNLGKLSFTVVGNTTKEQFNAIVAAFNTSDED